MPRIPPEDIADLQALAAEAMGWQPMGAGAYFHQGRKESEGQTEQVVHIVGLPDLALTGESVFLLT
jgi:hypothetical protein